MPDGESHRSGKERCFEFCRLRRRVRFPPGPILRASDGSVTARGQRRARRAGSIPAGGSTQGISLHSFPCTAFMAIGPKNRRLQGKASAGLRHVRAGVKVLIGSHPPKLCAVTKDPTPHFIRSCSSSRLATRSAVASWPQRSLHCRSLFLPECIFERPARPGV